VKFVCSGLLPKPELTIAGCVGNHPECWPGGVHFLKCDGPAQFIIASLPSRRDQARPVELADTRKQSKPGRMTSTRPSVLLSCASRCGWAASSYGNIDMNSTRARLSGMSMRTPRRHDNPRSVAYAAARCRRSAHALHDEELGVRYITANVIVPGGIANDFRGRMLLPIFARGRLSAPHPAWRELPTLL
jgi:hypothetical protein